VLRLDVVRSRRAIHSEGFWGHRQHGMGTIENVCLATQSARVEYGSTSQARGCDKRFPHTHHPPRR
jgi:hypothetical protein